MPTKSILLLSTVLISLPAAAQIYKCPDGSGRNVIQQTPCAGGQAMDVKPASGRVTQPLPSAAPAARAAPGASAPAKPMTETERLNALSDASARQRRMRDLDELFVPRARRAVYQQRSQCDAKIAELKQGQYTYRQNLYGKTHAAQVASEMAAVSAQCDTKDRALVAEHEKLLAECKSLGGCKDMAL